MPITWRANYILTAIFPNSQLLLFSWQGKVFVRYMFIHIFVVNFSILVSSKLNSFNLMWIPFFTYRARKWSFVLDTELRWRDMKMVSKDHNFLTWFRLSWTSFYSRWLLQLAWIGRRLWKWWLVIWYNISKKKFWLLHLFS